jgi:hypothetical protein
MPIIGATQLEPVNVVSNYLAGQEMRRNALLQQQEAMRAQQRMELEQRRFQREEDTAASEAQNALLRRQALATGDPRAMFAAGLTKEAGEFADLEYNERKRGLEELTQQAGAFVSNPAFLTPDRVLPWAQDAAQRNRISPQAFEQIVAARTPAELGGVLAQIRDQGLTVAQQLADQRARETAARDQQRIALEQQRVGLDRQRVGLESRRVSLAEQTATQPAEGAKPPVGYEYAPDGSLRSIKGGPADPDVIAAKKRAEAAPATEARAKTAQQGINTVNASILELRSAYESLKNKGAIPSEVMASMGLPGMTANLGAYAAASETGQAVGRAFGSEAQSDRDVIRAANMRLASAIARATGQTSQQLNSNVELQLALKSLGDPQSSYESNLRILDYLDRFVRENYAGDATGAAAPAPGSATRQTASGTSYTIEE